MVSESAVVAVAVVMEEVLVAAPAVAVAKPDATAGELPVASVPAVVREYGEGSGEAVA